MPSVCEVIELVEHALQIAAVAAVEHAVLEEVRAELLLPIGAGVPVAGPRRNLPSSPARRRATSSDSRVGSFVGIAVGEPLGKDLVEDGVGRPIGDGWRERLESAEAVADDAGIRASPVCRVATLVNRNRRCSQRAFRCCVLAS